MAKTVGLTSRHGEAALWGEPEIPTGGQLSTRFRRLDLGQLTLTTRCQKGEFLPQRRPSPTLVIFDRSGPLS
jgi:hypothetical protein